MAEINSIEFMGGRAADIGAFFIHPFSDTRNIIYLSKSSSQLLRIFLSIDRIFRRSHCRIEYVVHIVTRGIWVANIGLNASRTGMLYL